MLTSPTSDFIGGSPSPSKMERAEREMLIGKYILLHKVEKGDHEQSEWWMRNKRREK
jgi:hypothetical protein